MILRVVASGKLKLSDFVHQYFPYWTTDPDDPRSRIQLSHLLSFTSGYFSPVRAGDVYAGVVLMYDDIFCSVVLSPHACSSSTSIIHPAGRFDPTRGTGRTWRASATRA